MSPLVLVVGGLVTWRVSNILAKQGGPLNIFHRFRAFLAHRQKRMGGLFDMISCVTCVSIYVGAITAVCVAPDVFRGIAYALSFSAIASIIEAHVSSKS